MTSTWKIAVVAAATAVGATTAVVALTDRGAAPASATVPPDGDSGDPSPDRTERSVSVSGHGTVEVQPDLAELMMGVTSTDPDAATVYSTIQTGSQTLVESLQGLGIAAEDIQTSGLNIYP